RSSRSLKLKSIIVLLRRSALRSDGKGAFQDAQRARVPEPHLDGMLADEAVATEGLDPGVGDPESALSGIAPRLEARLRRARAPLQLAPPPPPKPTRRPHPA